MTVGVAEQGPDFLRQILGVRHARLHRQLVLGASLFGVERARRPEHESLTLAHGGVAQVKLARNLYWRADGKDYEFAGKSRAAWLATGLDAGSVFVIAYFGRSR